MTADAFAPVARIAEALLYEGYLLFPYRATALKNRMRVSFGELAPEATRAFRRSFQTAEIPLAANARTRVRARIAFLQPVRRTVRDAAGQEVARAVVGGRDVSSWEEAREVIALHGPWPLDALRGEGVEVRVEADAVDALEELRVTDAGPVVARVERRSAPVVAAVRVAVRAVPGLALTEDDALILTCTIRNASAGIEDDALALVHSAHVALVVEEGAFASVVDPPEALSAAAAGCEPDGAWFVLAGGPGDRHLALASPIILADHPAIAGESPADLFDATENDELLTLCMRALGDDERRAIAATDPRAAALLERVTALDDEEMGALHGAVRGFRQPGGAGWIRVGEELVGVGDAVVLAPTGGESLDAALAGRRARVVDVLVTVEGREHLVVVLDDDPGRDFGADTHALGHRFFIAPGEARRAPAGDPS